MNFMNLLKPFSKIKTKLMYQNQKYQTILQLEKIKKKHYVNSVASYNSVYEYLNHFYNISEEHYNELITEVKNDDLYEYILNCYRKYTNSLYYNWDPRKTINFFYASIRCLQPKLVIETGVAYGFSSMIILLALKHNDSGNLISIDFPLSDIIKMNRSPGWLVPHSLRDRWTLNIGKSEDYLPNIVSDKNKSIDLFIHDSSHKYDHMLWEYGIVWDRISDNGLFISDDVLMNSAFTDFSNNKGLTPNLILNRYGFLRK